MAEGGYISDEGELEDKFICSICLEPFKKPKILPCFHSFCTHCLAGHIKTNKDITFECPLCRSTVNIPKDGVEGFQSNFYLEREESDFQDGCILCDICGPRSVAILRCDSCEENFCSKCSNAHRKMKATRNHELNEQPVFISKARMIRSELTSLVDSEGQATIKKLQDKVGYIEHLNIKATRSLEDDLKSIRDHGKSFHCAVDILLKELEECTEECYASKIHENEEVILRCQEEHRQWMQTIDSAKPLVRATDMEVVQKGSRISTKLRQRGQVDSLCKSKGVDVESVFRPGNIDMELVKRMLGSLTETISKPAQGRKAKTAGSAEKRKEKKKQVTQAADSSWDIANGKVIKLPVGKLKVFGIAPVLDCKAWVTCFSSQRLFLIDINGNILNSIDVGTVCDSVVADDSGNCYVSCPASKVVKRISVENFNIETVTPELEWFPRGIAIVEGDEQPQLLVTCTNSRYNSYKGSILLVNLSKSLDTNPLVIRKKEWSRPVRLAVEKESGCMCICDSYTCEVKLHTRKGETYVCYGKYGPGYTKGSRNNGLFDPFSLCFDSEGDLIISDFTSSRIHRVTRRPKFVEQFCLSMVPYSVAVDRNNNLWIGYGEGLIEVYKKKKEPKRS